MTSREVVVCYHWPCIDGIFSALIAREHLKHEPCLIRYVPLNTSETPKVENLHLRGRERVYLLDFAGPHGFVEDIAKRCAQLVVIDHHLTARDALFQSPLPPNVVLIFSLKKCAATLAFEYFQPKISSQMLQMIKLTIAVYIWFELWCYRLVEDADLWRLELPDTHAFRAGIGALKMNWDARNNPAIFDELLALDLPSLLRSGAVIHQQQEKEVGEALGHSFVVDLSRAGSWGPCLAVVGSQFSRLRSLIGNGLAERALGRGLRGIGIVAYHEARLNDTSRIKLSFRSVPEENTTLITEALGGGGHRNASSCIIETSQFERWRK